MSDKEKKGKRSSKRPRHSTEESGRSSVLETSDQELGLPDGVRTRLLDLFSQITKELETVYAENVARKCRVTLLGVGM